MGKKFDCDMIAKSTFSNVGGTKICQQIESSEVKSIIKNDNLVEIKIENQEFYHIYQSLLENNIMVEDFQKEENEIRFRIKKDVRNKVIEILDNKYPSCRLEQEEIVKLSIVGYGITQDNRVLNQVIEMLKKHHIQISNINLSQSKIEILVKEIENDIVQLIHGKLIQK
ncbi:MAG: hypothetical protein HFJ35_06550 [Clostridia bacterium]|nr:hypothetical protein [Clostridia bacterium]